MYIEFIATTIEDAILIEKSGADRIELVSSLTEGGLTPSHALIEAIVRSVNIPVNVMVRPHSQSFCYSQSDLDIMKNDIEMISTLGANGVVLGALNEKNEINRSYLEVLLKACEGLDVTFHRAIDDTPDPVRSAQMLAKYPEITTILTSGGHGDFPSRMKTILQMKNVCGDISLLAGSGLNKDNILSISSELNTGYYHFGTAVRRNNSLIEGVQLEKAKEIVSMLKI
ncbi:copper homeostasis protein CutC [Peribacillus sp. Bi96]|uniref:copper homeostasis protein CutC n=1 Tax=Peribacillus sp. Bi96 TaxID=2884273 RepID=UPI001E614C14|nr:copper homeostasis protein CutC [Peribacillus sp. Bi96]